MFAAYGGVNIALFCFVVLVMKLYPDGAEGNSFSECLVK